ncbi:unnamed protein product [Lepeophtheirus salmonis]|uniref:(salmon louse) hypothetical protein n=1 Tax=Lepeophtheirus salmonis TaxID=72036 RepID=A0A7R8CVG8_LEPSM|nr:unnamed protein product [Lepeophtheirus salmonis]CAF2943705.1 unnamed protein product [Lepeophtheirus salmonis]
MTCSGKYLQILEVFVSTNDGSPSEAVSCIGPPSLIETNSVGTPDVPKECSIDYNGKLHHDGKNNENNISDIEAIRTDKDSEDNTQPESKFDSPLVVKETNTTKNSPVKKAFTGIFGSKDDQVTCN